MRRTTSPPPRRPLAPDAGHPVAPPSASVAPLSLPALLESAARKDLEEVVVGTSSGVHPWSEKGDEARRGGGGGSKRDGSGNDGRAGSNSNGVGGAAPSSAPSAAGVCLPSRDLWGQM
jgi:hypothetical protein